MKRTNHRLLSGLAASGTIVVTALAMSTPAQALATTYTPTASGGISFELLGPDVVFTDIDANQSLSCETFTLDGSVVDSGASRDYGANGGTLDSLDSGGPGGCWNDVAGDTTVEPTGEWGVTVTGDEISTDVWPATLTSVTVEVAATGCEFTAGGELEGTFDAATQEFQPSNPNLTITSDPSGQLVCDILGIAQGDEIDVDGAWVNVGATLTISNP